MERIALTLPGGGARAAYQAGVLRAISDICKFKKSPFQIISGISAGGINGMWVAAGAQDFDRCTQLMWDDWKNLAVHDVFKTDPLTLLETGTTWIRNLSMGNWFNKSHATYLLDTAPLTQLLNDKIDFATIQANLDNGSIYGLSLSATDYHTGQAVTFFAGDEKIKPWKATLSSGRRSRLTIDHIMASAAIPVFFPPVRIEHRDYGDGGVGLQTPLSPTIHMGATRMLVIGVQNPAEASEKEETSHHHATLGDISGSLLNALFLNSLDADVSRMKKINQTVSVFTPQQLKQDVPGYRDVQILVIRPSRDLSFVGAKEFNHFPFAIRHMLKGLGVTNRKGWDLLSYLAFDQVYSAALLELGYSDTLAMKKDVVKFFK